MPYQLRFRASSVSGNITSRGKAMCEIGNPIEIIYVEPLSLPVPLLRREEKPPEQPVAVEVPVSEATVEPNPAP